MPVTTICGLGVQDIGNVWRPRNPYSERVEAEDWLVPFIGHRHYLDYIRRNGGPAPHTKGTSFYTAKLGNVVGKAIASTSAYPSFLAYTQDDEPKGESNDDVQKFNPVFTSGVIQHYALGTVAEIFGTDWNFAPRYTPNGSFYPNTLRGNPQRTKFPVAGYVALPFNAILNPNDIIVHHPAEASIRYFQKSTHRDYPTRIGGTICAENGYGLGGVTTLTIIKTALEFNTIRYILCRPELVYALSWTAYRKIVGRSLKIQLMPMEDFRAHMRFFEKFLGLGQFKKIIELPNVATLTSDVVDVKFSTSFEKAYAPFADGWDQLPAEAIDEDEEPDDPFAVFVPSKATSPMSKVIARLAPNDGFRAPLPLP